MFDTLFRRKRPAPLFEYVATMTPERVGAWCEQNEQNDEFIPLTFGLLMVSTAGHFLRVDVPLLKTSLHAVPRDVIAFEAVLFSAFSVREYYEPIESESTDESVKQAFRGGYAVARSMIKGKLGKDYREIFDQRLMEYAKANYRGGIKEAAEVFRGILQSIGVEPTPKATYGKMSLDLIGTIEAVGVIQIFASTMPKAMAESLHNLADHYGFFF